MDLHAEAARLLDEHRQRDLDFEAELNAARSAPLPQPDPRLAQAQQALDDELAARAADFAALGINTALIKRGRLGLSLRLCFAHTQEDPLRARSGFPFAKSFYDAPRKAGYCLVVEGASPVAGQRHNARHEAQTMVAQLLKKLRATEFGALHANEAKAARKAKSEKPERRPINGGASELIARALKSERAQMDALERIFTDARSKG